MHGISLGLAIDLASASDVRICAQQTRFAVKEVDIGLAADVGTLARLPRVVGNMSWVKDVCYSARDFGADEALSVGFVSQVHADKAAAVDAGIKMATFWASKSPVAVQGTKELLNHARDHTVAESEYHEMTPPWAFKFFVLLAEHSVANLFVRPAVHHDLEFGHVTVRRFQDGPHVHGTEEDAAV